ncbi:MAG: hypothetical protein IKJ94_01750 [Oscillospiraceae bacterium]|nr:hypothetical protein [Oscillospiraceae bacterium]
MKIQMLGSAAYDRVPAMFCQCPACLQARKLGGKNIRTQAQAFINDDLLIDFGQDNYIHFLNCGKDYTKIKNILLTHSHEDHFMPNELVMTTSWFGHNDIEEPIGVWGNADCKALFETNTREMKCQYHLVQPFETFQAGAYTVTALPAKHAKDDDLVYIISDGEKTILYNNDTGFWKEEVYAFVKENGFRFDFVASDCTFCLQEGNAGRSHMSLENNVAHRQRLVDMGAVTEQTPWLVTHYSHNNLIRDGKAVTAEELEEIVKDCGMIASFDGIQFEI